MIVSVVICTRNRAEALKSALASLVEMRKPAGEEWELLIVDNGSSDDTAQVVRSFANALPLRSLVEERPGLSHARNCGVAAASGRYILWTDDDVRVSPAWLEAYVSAFKAWPEAIVFGGPIEPVLEPPTPAWFLQNLDQLENILARRDASLMRAPMEAAENRLPYGANYAVRTREQRRHPYDPELGVCTHRRRLGEETQVLRALFKAGAQGVWAPQARITHIIPACRQREAYVLRYQRAAGESWAYLGDTDENFLGGRLHFDRGAVLHIPTWVWRHAGRHLCLYLILRPFAPSRLWLKHLKAYGFYRGAIDYGLRATTWRGLKRQTGPMSP